MSYPFPPVTEGYPAKYHDTTSSLIT